MKNFSRGVSFILCIVMVFSLLPVFVQAEEAEVQTDSGDVTVEGTNSLGVLLSEDIEEYQQTDETAGGYNVVDLTVENGVATAQFRTLEEAVLIVCVYTEDGLQLLTSGYTRVQAEDSTASIAFEEELPEYFTASAYLVDTYDHSPLCTAYETVMYTQEMQELLASTVDDYDPELVLNLDEDTDTNFAVYEEATIVIEQQSGINTVTSVDDENAVYVIENADESITSLNAGDIFVLPYGEDNVLIVKVGAISLDGTTATVTGADVELEEVFSCLKIESDGQTEDITVDESTGDEEVTYVGMVEEANPAVRNSSGDFTGSLNLGFEFKQKSGSVSYSGALNVNIKIGFSYYISVTKQQIKLTVDTKTNLSFKFGGKVEFEKKLPNLKFSPIPAVSIGFEPKVVFTISAEIEFVASVVNKTGFFYERGKGVQNLSTAPKIELDINAEGKVFFGIDFAPTAGVLKGKIAELKLSALAGVELTGKMCGTLYDGVTVAGGEPEKSIHDCESCLEVTIKGKIEMKLSLEFLNMSFLKVEFKLAEKVFEIGACYYSFDEDEFGWGECPNVSYRVTVLVKDPNGATVEDVEVFAQWIDQKLEIPMGSTNNAGTAVKYLTGGTYTLTATVDGETLERTVKISKACKVDLNRYTVDLTGFLPGTEPDSVTDAGVLAHGTCGEDLTWKLDNNGTMTISGTGMMYNWTSHKRLPWYYNRSEIKSIIIKDGVTGIGDFAFAHCSQLVEVTIPSSVDKVGMYAFYYCLNLKSVRIADGLQSVGFGAFQGCESIAEFYLPASVTSIGAVAFSDCTSMTRFVVDSDNAKFSNDSYGVLYNKDKTKLLRVPEKLSGEFIVPNSVTSVEGYSFTECEKISSIIILDQVTSIGESAFSRCTGLKNIYIGKSVATVGDGAFSDCSGLTSLTIPNSVTSIGNDAFGNCTGLTSVTISNGVTSIGGYAFYGCGSLASVTIPKSVIRIGNNAFYYCSGLTDMRFEGDAPSIGANCFWGVMASAYYPAGNSTWTTEVLQSYGGTITWVAYDLATGVQADAVTVSSTEELQEDTAEKTADADTKSPSTRGVFGGEYDTQVTESYTLKSASFSGLAAGEEYLLLAMVSLEAEDPLAADNLLAVAQGQAEEDGTLTFVYVQRVDTAVSYVMACGPSNKSLEDAQISFPYMTKTDLLRAVDPVVTYDGEVLTEGLDYTVVGTVDYTAAGTYTCYIRGIYNYTGLVECSYTVQNAALTETEDRLLLSLDGDCSVIPELNKDLYVDLNGFDLTGTVKTNGFAVCGMDSTTDGYTCDSIGCFNCVDENGGEIVPVRHFKTDGKRYMAIRDESGYSFHRFYLGITHQTLKPAASGVGYKAVFCGDDMVRSELDSYGFTMELSGNDPVTVTKTADSFTSGEAVTLRIDNYDVDRFGETALTASVMVKLSDGTVIRGTEQTMTLRGLLEQLNESYAALSEEQLTAVADFISRYPVTQTWETENLYT